MFVSSERSAAVAALLAAHCAAVADRCIYTLYLYIYMYMSIVVHSYMYIYLFTRDAGRDCRIQSFLAV